MSTPRLGPPFILSAYERKRPQILQRSHRQVILQQENHQDTIKDF